MFYDAKYLKINAFTEKGREEELSRITKNLKKSGWFLGEYIDEGLLGKNIASFYRTPENTKIYHHVTKISWVVFATVIFIPFLLLNTLIEVNDNTVLFIILSSVSASIKFVIKEKLLHTYLKNNTENIARITNRGSFRCKPASADFLSIAKNKGIEGKINFMTLDDKTGILIDNISFKLALIKETGEVSILDLLMLDEARIIENEKTICRESIRKLLAHNYPVAILIGGLLFSSCFAEMNNEAITIHDPEKQDIKSLAILLKFRDCENEIIIPFIDGSVVINFNSFAHKCIREELAIRLETILTYALEVNKGEAKRAA